MKKLKLILFFIGITIAFQANAQTEAFKAPKGKRYHKKECKLLPEKKAVKTTIKKAKSKGLTACKVCKPVIKKTITKRTSKKNKDKKTKNTTKSTAVRCSAIAKTKGRQCKRRTKNGNGRCWQHQ
ncbi:MAG: hypothetical protein JXR05_12400 [Flavobacteriaceae bacterium]